MKVKILKGVACNPWHLSALPGDVIELEAKQAKELIAAERAEETDLPYFPVDEIAAEPEIIEEKPKKKKWKTSQPGYIIQRTTSQLKT